MKAESMFDALVEKVQALTAASVEDGEEIIALESEVDALTTERDALKIELAATRQAATSFHPIIFKIT